MAPEISQASEVASRFTQADEQEISAFVYAKPASHGPGTLFPFKMAPLLQNPSWKLMMSVSVWSVMNKQPSLTLASLAQVIPPIC
jgi:hypothetical protein